MRRLSEQYDNGAIFQFYVNPGGVDPTHSAPLIDDVDIQPLRKVPHRVAVTIAIVGAMRNKRFSPNHLMIPEETYSPAREARLAGAPSTHLYIHDERGYSVLDPDLFHQAIDPLEEEFPEVVIDGCMVCENLKEWEAMKILPKERPFETTPVNTNAIYNGDMLFYKPVYVMTEKRRLIQEAGIIPQITFYPLADVDHVNRYLVCSGLLEKPCNFLLLYGLPGCSPMDDPIAVMYTLMNTYHQPKSINPDCRITACAVGRASSFVAAQILLMGLNIRVGMEDVIWKYPHRNDKTSSNAKQLTEACIMARPLGRDAMTVREHRDYMGPPQKTQYREYGAMSNKAELFDFEERQPNVKMPGGRTWVFNSADNLTVKYSEIWDPAVSMHAYEAEQVNIVFGGKVLFRVGEEVYELRKGTIIRIPPNQPHGLEKKPSAEDFRVIQLISSREGTMESLRVKTMGLEGRPAL